jgi:hypothetical protein
VCLSTDLCAAEWTALPGIQQRPITTSRGSHESQRLVYTDLRQRPATSSYAVRTFTAGKLRARCACGTLRCAFQRDDRQMPHSTEEVDLECASIAGLSGD